jgi:hypothetical protein
MNQQKEIMHSIYCKCHGEWVCDECHYTLKNPIYVSGTTIAPPIKNPDYIINGFSIKDTILDCLNELDTDDMEYIAQHITDALATKLRLKQG